MSKITFESVMEEIRASLGEARLRQIAEEEPGMFDRLKKGVQDTQDQVSAAATGAAGVVQQAGADVRAFMQKNRTGPTPAEPTNNTPAPTTEPKSTLPSMAAGSRLGPSTFQGNTPADKTVDYKTAMGDTGAKKAGSFGVDAFKNTAPSTSTPAPSPGSTAKTAIGPTTKVPEVIASKDERTRVAPASASRSSAPAAPNVRAPVPTARPSAPAASTVKAPSSADEYSRSRNSGSDEVGGSAADLIRGDRAAAAERAAAVTSKPTAPARTAARPAAPARTAARPAPSPGSTAKTATGPTTKPKGNSALNTTRNPMVPNTMVAENFEQFVLNRAKGKSS